MQEGRLVDRRAFNSLLIASVGGIACEGAAKEAAAPCPAPLNAGGLTEADFREYIAAFNRDDFEGFGRYYADDVIFEGRAGQFRKRADVLSFYRTVKSRLRERITIHDIILGELDIVADLETELQAFADWPDFPTGPIRKGQTIRSQNFIWYDVRDGKFVRIRSSHYRQL
jgi:hypothetical protein